MSLELHLPHPRRGAGNLLLKDRLFAYLHSTNGRESGQVTAESEVYDFVPAPIFPVPSLPIRRMCAPFRYAMLEPEAEFYASGVNHEQYRQPNLGSHLEPQRHPRRANMKGYPDNSRIGERG